MPDEIDRTFTNVKRTRYYEWGGKPVEITMEFPQELELIDNGTDIIEAMFADAFDRVKSNTAECITRLCNVKATCNDNRQAAT